MKAGTKPGMIDSSIGCGGSSSNGGAHPIHGTSRGRGCFGSFFASAFETHAAFSYSTSVEHLEVLALRPTEAQREVGLAARHVEVPRGRQHLDPDRRMP